MPDDPSNGARTGSGRHGGTVFAAFALAGLALFLHASALGGWWLFDDPQLVIEAIRQPLLGALFRPADYLHLAAHTFTPLLVASFKLDLAAAGVSPRAFYAHQVVSLIAASLLFFALLRRYSGLTHAFIGAALLIASWQVTYSARTLMIRHYIEALVFALAALLAWSSRPSVRREIAGSAAYLFSLLCKEIFAPLPLILIVQSRAEGEPWRTTVRRLLAPAVTLVVFIAWRWAMTGLLGGYNTPPSASQILALPARLWEQHVGPGPAWLHVLWLGATVVILVAGLAAARARLAIVMLAFAAVAVLPVAPLAASLEWRYAFAYTVLLIALLAFASHASQSRVVTALLALLTIGTAIGATHQRREYQATTRASTLEGRYIWTAPSTAPALAATAPEWYLDGLSWLRARGGHGTSPRFVCSRFALTSGEFDPAHVVVLDQLGQPAPVSWISADDPRSAQFGRPESWPRERALLQPLPLGVEMKFDRGEVTWGFRPADGRFFFISEPGWSATELPAAGTRRVAAPRDRHDFRVARVLPNGAWTLSPRLPVPQDGASTTWSAAGNRVAR